MDLSDEQQATESAEDTALVKAVGEKLAARAPNVICPFCSNRVWYVLHEKQVFPVVILPNLNNYATYTVACTNCGFVRQHLRPIIEGEITGEVDYAQPRR